MIRRPLIAYMDQKQWMSGAWIILFLNVLAISGVLLLPAIEVSFTTIQKSILTISLTSIKLFLWFLIVLSSVVLFNVLLMIKYYLFKRNEPYLIINKKGIWIQVFNLIPWSNIDRAVLLHGGDPTNCIAIKLHNRRLAIKESDILGKIGIFNNFITKRPYDITVAGLDVSNEEIITYLNNYTK